MYAIVVNDYESIIFVEIVIECNVLFRTKIVRKRTHTT